MQQYGIKHSIRERRVRRRRTSRAQSTLVGELMTRRWLLLSLPKSTIVLILLVLDGVKYKKIIEFDVEK